MQIPLSQEETQKPPQQVVTPGDQRWQSLPLNRAFKRGATTGWAIVMLVVLAVTGSARAQGDPSVNPNYPTNVTVSLGATAYFRLSANTANAPMSYQWQHDGIDIPGATNWFLWVTNVALADAGGYRALIWNAIGESTNTRTATLSVDPMFVKVAIDNGPADMWNPYWVDLDRDGWLEMVVAGGWGTAGGRPFMVFENNRDGTLRRDLTNDLAKVSMRLATIAWADLDNDGDLDGFAGCNENEKPAFLRNLGGGRFTKTIIDRWSTANGIAPLGSTVASADIDDDGTLDVLLGYWGNGATGTYGTNAVLRGLGNGRFEVDRTSALAISRTWTEQWDWADWDGDGKLDLFGAASGDANQLDLMFQNLGGGQYRRITNSPLAQVRDFSVDSAWGDYDNDGDLDVLVTSGGKTNQLYFNLGNGVFEPDPSGPSFQTGGATGMAGWGDYDNDGWLDLYVAQWGRVSRFFHNRGNGTFEEITTGSPVGECKVYSCAWGDYDNDGFLDLCGTSTDGYNYLYRNNLRQVGNTNHWLKVRLVGTASNRDGIGATIRIKTTVAGKELWQMRQIVCQSHAAELIAHFGLGEATSVDLLRIQWPSGIVQEVANLSADQVRTITEVAGITPARTAISVNASITLASQTPGLSYQWQLEGVDLAGQTRGNLVLANVTADMAGRYSVVISNVSGLLTNVAYLTVDSTFSKITEGPLVADRLATTGGSWVDIDQDGYIDLVVWNGGLSGDLQTNQVFRNNRAGGFERLTAAQAGDVVGITGKWWAGVWGDLDRDGDVDGVAFRDSSISAMKYFLNNGSGFFADWISSDPLVSDKHGGLASLGDYDNDGWLDVSVISAYGSVYTNRLYHGVGEGRFERVTSGPIVRDRFVGTEAQAWSDYDGDGDLDLIVTDPAAWWQDPQASPIGLYRNDGGGQFTRITKGAIAEAKGAFLVPAWADYDNDGRLDLFLSDYGGPSRLFHNEGNGEFTSQTIQTGPASAYPAWGDFDNDGDLDLVLATGQANDQTNLFFLNEGGQLTRATMGSLTTELGKTAPILWGDYDNDGFLDLFVGRAYNEINSLFHNNGNSNHWVMVSLKGTTSNPSAIGAKVRVHASIRDKSVWQMREISGGNRYQGDPRAHFGLGNATNAITVRVEWPSGTVQQLSNVAADQILEVIEPRRPIMNGALLPDGSYEVAFTTELDRTYELQASDDLETWVTVTTFTGTGNVVQVLDLAPLAAQRFYRVISR